MVLKDIRHLVKKKAKLAYTPDTVAAIVQGIRNDEIYRNKTLMLCLWGNLIFFYLLLLSATIREYRRYVNDQININIFVLILFTHHSTIPEPMIAQKSFMPNIAEFQHSKWGEAPNYKV